MDETKQFHQRMGRVWHQPVTVHSLTNKRITVNFRAPLQQLQKLLPDAVEADEIGSTGLGMISMCACDFAVNKVGPFPVPPIHADEMLCRMSAKVRKGGRTYRAYYTLRSDSSSLILGTLGKYFSHFRKNISTFSRSDDGTVYEIDCRSDEAIAGGRLRASLDSVSKTKPDTTIFEDIEGAIQFIYEVDGSCGYSYRHNKLSLQHLVHPDWDISFCHEFEYDFNLLDYIFGTYNIDAEMDCSLYMENTGHAWQACWLYSPEQAPVQHADPAAA
jgi:hypothetical protein